MNAEFRSLIEQYRILQQSDAQGPPLWQAALPALRAGGWTDVPPDWRAGVEAAAERIAADEALAAHKPCRKLAGWLTHRQAIEREIAAREQATDLVPRRDPFTRIESIDSLRDLLLAYASALTAGFREQPIQRKICFALLHGHGAGATDELDDEALLELLRILDAPAAGLLRRLHACCADQGAGKHRRWRAVRDRVEALSPAVHRVLDLGCGEGELALLLLLAGRRVVALDADGQALRGLRDLRRIAAVAERLAVVEQDLLAGGLPSNVDLVLLVETIEHLPREALEPLLADLLRGGARILLTTPNRDENERLRAEGKIPPAGLRHGHHTYELTPAELHQALAALLPHDAFRIEGIDDDGQIQPSPAGCPTLLAELQGAPEPAEPEDLRTAIVELYRAYRANPLDEKKLHRFPLDGFELWVFSKTPGKEGSVVLVDQTGEVRAVSRGYQSIRGFESDRTGPAAAAIAEAFEHFAGREFAIQPKLDGSAVLARRFHVDDLSRTLFFTRGHLLPEKFASLLEPRFAGPALDALLDRGYIPVGEMVGRHTPPAGVPLWEEFAPELVEVDWLVFDLIGPDDRFVPLDQLAPLCHEAGLPLVPTLARARCATLDEFTAQVRRALDRVNGVKGPGGRSVPDHYGEGDPRRFQLRIDERQYVIDGLIFRTTDGEERFKIKPDLRARWKDWHARARRLRKGGPAATDRLAALDTLLHELAGEGLDSLLANLIEKAEKEPEGGPSLVRQVAELAVEELVRKGVARDQVSKKQLKQRIGSIVAARGGR